MTAALKYEWVRIRTIRSTWWLTVLAVGFGTAVAFLVAWGYSQAFQMPQPPSAEEAHRLAPLVVGHFSGDGAPFFLPYFLAMIGVFAWGHEYRHGMIRATLTAVPSRTHAWVAKFAVVGAWVAGTTVLTLVLSAMAGWLWLHDDGIAFATSAVLVTVVKAVGYSLLFTWLAMALSAVLRVQAAAFVLMFLWPLALENILTVMLYAVPGLQGLAPLSRFLPYNAGARILSSQEVTTVFGDPLSPLGGFVVFGAAAAILMAFSLMLFRTRDA